jgi:hypothetical protein
MTSAGRAVAQGGAILLAIGGTIASLALTNLVGTVSFIAGVGIGAYLVVRRPGSQT